MNYYLSVLKNYGTFSGRARRSEYWMIALVNVVVSVILNLIDNAIGTTIKLDYGNGMNMTYNFGYISMLYSAAVLIPSIAVGVRRLHDVGKSGWFFFILFIPIIGAIWILILLVTDSKPGSNEYGQNPKEVEGDVLPGN